MKDLVRPALVICLVLAVPIVPFVFFGDHANQWIESYSQQTYSQAATFFIVVGILAGDIFLPTPSSVVSTMAGWQLGTALGTFASWLGMTLGAVLGFWLARQFGRPLAERLSNASHLGRMDASSAKFGPLVLVIARGVPVFAEASVLLMGIHGLSWRRFLIPIVLSNLGIALAYSAFGEYAQQHEWLPLALGVSIALPVVLTMMTLRWLPREGDSKSTITSKQ